MPINQTTNVTTALVEAYGIATEKRNEFLTPEHLLAGYLRDRDFWDAFSGCGRAQELEAGLYEYINTLEHVPQEAELAIDFSVQLQELFETAAQAASSAMAPVVHTHHVIYAFFHLEDSHARYNLEKCLDSSIPDFLNSLIDMSEETDTALNEGEGDGKNQSQAQGNGCAGGAAPVIGDRQTGNAGDKREKNGKQVILS